MRAITRYVLAPAAIAAAVFVAAPAAHFGGYSPAHSRTSLAGPICPQGTNWDDVLGICR
ncbi:MAG TPA: hypothetical protein VFI65_09140 [Streptosporangiaceae bacterium]|nr:hypothetical protein [Streptosporangiaceae bacterium]